MKFSERFTTFFRTLSQSCYDMEFYRKVRTRPPARALAYVAAFFVLLSVVFGLAVVLPGLHSIFGAVRQGLNQELPDGTSFEIKDGHFSTSLPPGTEFRYKDIAIVLDPTLEGLNFPAAFEDRTGNYLGRDALFSQYLDGQQDVVSLKDLPDLNVTKEQAQAWFAKWGWPYVALGTVLATVLRFLLTFFSALLFAAAAALGGLFAGKMGRVKMNYSQWLAVSLYAVTLPTIVDFIFFYLGLDMPLVFVVIFFMIIYAVLLDERMRPVKKVGSGKLEAGS